VKPRKQVANWLSTSETVDRVEVLIPLFAAEQLIGLMALGNRWDEEILDERDLQVMELIAQQVSLFLLTASQVEELSQVPRRLAEAQKRERARIAQELHDTVQQFLGGLPFYLESSCEMLHSEPDKAEALLRACLADAADMIRVMHEIRNDLAPGQLETNFAHAVAELIERFRHRTNVEIQAEIRSDLVPCISLETRHALYRVLQQALDNVAAHARAQSVLVSLVSKRDRLEFHVIDDGRGSSEAERAQARAAGSLGLQSMADRVQALGGELHYASSPGRGTRISGWVPADGP
jgi:signal transduction histidine kinase